MEYPVLWRQHQSTPVLLVNFPWTCPYVLIALFVAYLSVTSELVNLTVPVNHLTVMPPKLHLQKQSLCLFSVRVTSIARHPCNEGLNIWLCQISLFLWNCKARKWWQSKWITQSIVYSWSSLIKAFIAFRLPRESYTLV